MPGEAFRVAVIGICLLAISILPFGCSSGNSGPNRFGGSPGSISSEMDLVHGHSSAVDLLFTPDGKYLVSWEPQPEPRGSAQLYVWDTRSWDPVGVLDLNDNASHEVDALPDNTILHSITNRGDGSYRQYRIVPPPLSDEPEDPRPIEQVPVEMRRQWSDRSPSGRYEAYRPLESGLSSRTRIVVVDLETGKSIADITPYGGAAQVQGFSPDSRYLIFNGSHRLRSNRAAAGPPEPFTAEPAMRMWDLLANREAPRWSEEPGGTGAWRLLGFNSDGKQMICIDEQATVWVVEFATGQPISQYELSAEPASVVLSPDGSLLAFGTEDGRTTAFDLLTQRSYTWDTGTDINGRHVFSPDSKRLISSGSEQAPSMFVWKTDAIRRAMNRAPK